MRSNYLNIIFGSLFGKFKCVIKTTGLVYLQNCSITCLYSCRSLQDFSICYQEIIACYQNIWKFFGQNSHLVKSFFVNRILGIRKFIFLNYRSEEHTSELQSLAYLVCRLLLEKKKTQQILDGRADGAMTAEATRQGIALHPSGLALGIAVPAAIGTADQSATRSPLRRGERHGH